MISGSGVFRIARECDSLTLIESLDYCIINRVEPHSIVSLQYDRIRSGIVNIKIQLEL